MGLTDLTVRLMLIFFPGIICFFVFDAFTAHRERKVYEILLCSYIYGMLSYFIYGLLLFLGLTISLAWGGGIRSWKIPVFGWLADVKTELDFLPIAAATVIAFVLAFVLSFCHRKKLLHTIGQRFEVTTKFAELDVWNFAFNLDDARWCVVRDMENNLMFHGYIRAFSDVGEASELLLTQVEVYDEKTSELCYQADRIYLARKKDNLTIQFYDTPQGEEIVDGGKTETADERAGKSDSSVAGRNATEGEPESGQHQHVPTGQAGGSSPSGSGGGAKKDK